jgi:hypothetical protein
LRFTTSSPLSWLGHRSQQLSGRLEIHHQLAAQLARHARRQRLARGPGEHGEGSRHRIGPRHVGRAQRTDEMVEAQIALGRRARASDQVRDLAEMFPLAHQLQRTERGGAIELRLARRRCGRLGVALVIEALDGYDVALHREGAEQKIGEEPRLLGVGIGAAVLGDVPREPGEGERAGCHHLVHAGRRREEAGEVAHGELDAIEDLRQRRQLAELGQTAQRLHPTDHGVERLALARGVLKGSGRAIEGARDQRTFPAHERADAGVELAVLAAPLGRARGRPPGQGFQRQREPARTHGVAIVPFADPPDQEPELLDRLGHLIPAVGVPGAPALAQRPGHRFEPSRGARDGLLGGHQRGAAQHPAGAEKVLRRRGVVPPGERLEPVETFAGFQREEFRRREGVGHRQ